MKKSSLPALSKRLFCAVLFCTTVAFPAYGQEQAQEIPYQPGAVADAIESGKPIPANLVEPQAVAPAPAANTQMSEQSSVPASENQALVNACYRIGIQLSSMSLPTYVAYARPTSAAAQAGVDCKDRVTSLRLSDDNLSITIERRGNKRFGANACSGDTIPPQTLVFSVRSGALVRKIAHAKAELN